MATHRLAPLFVVLLASCAGTDASPDDTDVVADTDSDLTEQATVSGTITWNVDFNAAGEAAGGTDCAYTRTYAGVEDNSAPWLCPECESVFLADVTLSEGRTECYDQVTTAAPGETEWLGFGGGVWYRGSGGWLTERGPAMRDGDSFNVSQAVSDTESGGDFAFDIQGTLGVGVQQGDPFAGWSPAETYECGWPKADPAPYEGDYVAALGATLPDGVFHDVCEDVVRLHDFAGAYLVVEISAMDCPPCQAAAGQEEAFVAAMADEGLPVHVITMLAPSLSDTAGTPTTGELEEWIEAFDLHSPVLADRVWGLSVVGQHADDFGYPTFLVVAPDLEILHIGVGFSSYDEFAEVIRADAG